MDSMAGKVILESDLCRRANCSHTSTLLYPPDEPWISVDRLATEQLDSSVESSMNHHCTPWFRDSWFRVDPFNSSSSPRNLKVTGTPQTLPFEVFQQRTASADSYDRAQHLPLRLSIAFIRLCEETIEPSTCHPWHGYLTGFQSSSTPRPPQSATMARKLQVCSKDGSIIPAYLAICETCGTQYDVSIKDVPSSCRICDVSAVTSTQLPTPNTDTHRTHASMFPHPANPGPVSIMHDLCKRT
jgi:hypothetical protein